MRRSRRSRVTPRGLARRDPGRRKRIRQGLLLFDELRGSVTKASWLDEDDPSFGRKQVGEQVLFVGQPREPGLHAIEEEPFRDAVEDIPRDR